MLSVHQFPLIEGEVIFYYRHRGIKLKATVAPSQLMLAHSLRDSVSVRQKMLKLLELCLCLQE